MPYRLADSKASGAIDRLAMSEYGLDGRTLMENAGSAAASLASFIMPETGTVTLFCGNGRNGGDGLVAARHLASACPRVNVVRVMPEPGRRIPGEVEANLRALSAGSGPIRLLEARTEEDLKEALILALKSALIIDALIGTGLNGPPTGLMASAIGIINEASGSGAGGEGIPVLSLDVPSGTSSDDGSAPGPSVRATHTLCFGTLKQGLFVEPAASLAGELYVSQIGMPDAALAPARGELLDAALAGGLIPPRKASFHKGDMGKVAVVAGSLDMPGAAVLASRGALSAGCGICELYVPEEAYAPVLASGMAAESMLRRLPSEAGRFTGEIPSCEAEALSQKDAIVIGPGAGRSDGVRELILAIMALKPGKLVLDADALWFIDPDFIREAGFYGELILTPHAGELSRMMRKAGLSGSRVEDALTAAKALNANVALKGPGTVVASPDGRFRITHAGNSAMATPGSGDVLAGVTGSFLARGMRGYDAMSAACFVHSLAGDIAAAHSPSAISASMIAERVPEAMVITDQSSGQSAGQSAYQSAERRAGQLLRTRTLPCEHIARKVHIRR